MASSPDELLDVVDADNCVIGQATRADIHARGLRHRAVHILLFDSSGRVFVQRRSRFKDTNPGLWDTSAAGHVDAGEAVVAAAVRELSEELGITLTAGSLQWLTQLPPGPVTGNEFVEVYRATSDATVTLEVDEIEDGRWFEPGELARSVTSNPDIYTKVFRQILTRAGAPAGISIPASG